MTWKNASKYHQEKIENGQKVATICWDDRKEYAQLWIRKKLIDTYFAEDFMDAVMKARKAYTEHLRR